MRDLRGINIVLPIYQQRNQRAYQPNSMYRPPNQSMYPRPNGSRGGIQRSNPNKMQGLMQRFMPTSAGLDTASRGAAGGLSNTLTNVQQVLKVVQSASPMIQEYGPMVKNLPAMYRMIKAFKDVESSNEEDKGDQTNQTLNKKSTESTEKTASELSKITGKSTPKLFI